MSKSKLPKEVLVYVYDSMEDGTLLYAAVEDIEQIPEDHHGEIVGTYIRNSTHTFRLKRELS